MRIKYADMRNKIAIIKKDFSYKEIKEDDFDGYVSLLMMLEVSEEWYVPRKNGKQDCILKNGYKWLGLYPKNKKYALTTIYNDKNEIVEFYFDMINNVGIENNVPYMDDLFLDLVFSQNGDKYILDEDELEEALDKNIISKAEYNIAYDTLHYLENIYEDKENFKNLIKFSNKYLNKFIKE